MLLHYPHFSIPLLMLRCSSLDNTLRHYFEGYLQPIEAYRIQIENAFHILTCHEWQLYQWFVSFQFLEKCHYRTSC